MADERGLSRRQVLAGLAAVGLAGCGGREFESATTASGDSTDTRSPPATPTPTVDRTPTATPSPTDTASPTDTPTTTPAVTSTDTQTPERRIQFTGGGADAFADALQTIREGPATELRIAAGTHTLDASRAPTYEYPRDGARVHFDGTGLEGVTIAGPPPGEGTAEIVLRDPTRGFLLFRNPAGAVSTDRPRGPTVRDLIVRHDPPPHTQGEITALSEDRRRVTLALEAGFPAFDEPPFVGESIERTYANVFTADGQRVRRVAGDERSNFKLIADAERVADREWELRLADGIETGGLAVGRRLAVMPLHGNGSVFNHADLVEPTYERVTVRSSPYRTFNFNACDRPVVRDCVVAPAGRLVSTNADGVHCNNCTRGPLVEGCRFERGGDDTVVADTELLEVTEFVDDRTVRVAVDFGTRVAAGDRLTVATAALEPDGTTPAVASVDERGGGQTEQAVNPETITFTESVRDRLSVGDLLTGPRMRNRETVVRETTVRSIRARFVRFGGVAGGLIEDCDFAGTHGDGIELDAAGTVGGASGTKGWCTDVRIRNTRIDAAGLVGVPSGVPRGVFVGVDGGEGPSADSVTGRPHRNVEITNVEIRGTAGHGIEIGDCVGAQVTDTQITNPGRIPVIDVGRYGLGVRNASDVRVADTRVTSETDDLLGFGWRRESERVRTQGNEFRVDGESRSSELDRL